MDEVVSTADPKSSGAVPLVSVLMTAYNREDYIGEAIESVLAQTFASFELIVVDDRSADRTREVVQHYLGDPRVRLVCNDRNLGDYPNRNHASTFARGELMKYHDSDDLMYPHCLEIMVSALQAHPSAAFALSGNAGWPGGPSPMLLTPRMCYQREFLGSGAVFRPGPAGALFRTDAFVELGRFPLGGIHSDTLFWIAACARRSVVLTQGDLLYYRVHAGQELQRLDVSYELARLEGIMFRAIDAPECPLDAAEREQAKRNLVAGFIRRTIRDVRNVQPRLALFRLKHSGLSLVEWLRYTRRPRRQTAAGTPPPLAKEQG